MRHLFTLLSACLLLSVSSARAEPEVGLLTIEPGDDMFERFGHSALRVRDGNDDVAYSYGAAPYDDPKFMWKFVRGEGDFFSLREPYAVTLWRYRMVDRTMQYQQLNLPSEAKQQLIAKLQQSLEPPFNRYRYDQLYDNCATRLRDLIDAASHDALKQAADKHDPKRAFRDDTLAAMSGHPLGHWALDLLGGPHQDLRQTGYQALYLPVNLRDRLAEARIVIEGREQPLASPSRVVHTRMKPPARSMRLHAARYTQLSMAALLLLLVVLGSHAKLASPLRAVAAFALLLQTLWSTLYGLLVVPLTVLSRVHNFSPNENALLFWPTDLLVLPALLRAMRAGQRISRLSRGYLTVRVCMLLGVLVMKALGVFTQHNATYVLLSGSFLLSAAWVARVSPRARSYPDAAPETTGDAAVRPL